MRPEGIHVSDNGEYVRRTLGKQPIKSKQSLSVENDHKKYFNQLKHVKE